MVIVESVPSAPPLFQAASSQSRSTSSKPGDLRTPAHPFVRQTPVSQAAAQPALSSVAPADLGAKPSWSYLTAPAAQALRQGCLASLNTGAGPVAAPRSPPRGNLPTTQNPRLTSSALGQPSMPPSGYKVQDRLALPPGRSSLGQLTLPEINCFILIVLRFSVY